MLEAYCRLFQGQSELTIDIYPKCIFYIGPTVFHCFTLSHNYIHGNLFIYFFMFHKYIGLVDVFMFF